MLKKSVLPLSMLIGLLVVWELVSRLLHIAVWILPAPTIILKEAIEDWGSYHHHLLSTISLTISGFAIGITVGVMIAVLLHLLPKLREAVYPLLVLSQNIPIIVLAPLLVIWFGFGVLPKLIIIVLVCFFPITVAMVDGLRQTSPELVHYMKMSGASKKQIFMKLELPHAIPQMFSGLKISATYSVMGAVISEWLGAQDGIGVYMTLASSSFRTDRVFVAILFIMLLCMLFFTVILLLEKYLLKWRPSQEEAS